MPLGQRLAEAIRAFTAIDEPRTTRRMTIGACVGICVVAAILLREQWTQMWGVPDLGDPLFSMWRVGWIAHWLHGDPRPLFSPNIFFPERLTLTYSDSMLLPSAMALPLQLLGVHPVLAYNTLLLSMFVLSGWATYVLVRDLTGSPAAAFVSAMLFAFYPFRFEHYSHLELQVMFWMPLALLAIHKFLRTRKARYVLLAALCADAQLYSSMYFGVFFVFYLIPVALVLWIAAGRPVRTIWRSTLVAALVAAVVALPLLRPYREAQKSKGERDISVVTFYSAEPIDYLSPHFRIATWYGLLPKDQYPERALFPGATVLSLGVVGLVPPLSAIQVAYAVGLATAFDASLGFHGLTYPFLYRWLAPVRGMRVPARFSAIAGMTMAILAGFGCRRLFRIVKRPRWRFALFLILVAAASIDLRPKLDLEPVWREPPAIYESVRGQRDAVLAEFPMGTGTGTFTPHVPFLYFSLWHWTNMVNGYSGFSPQWYPRFLEHVSKFPDPEGIDALKDHGVTHVSVNCALFGPECQNFLDSIDATGRFRQIAATRWQRDTVRLYELQR